MSKDTMTWFIILFDEEGRIFGLDSMMGDCLTLKAIAVNERMKESSIELEWNVLRIAKV
jgi:hypothetical protein